MALEDDVPATVASSGVPPGTGRQTVAELLGDRYEIVRKLGAGAFGEVYEAKDIALDRKVAVKRIRLDAFAEGPELEEVKQRFIQEAQVAAQLRHPGIVTIHDIGARGSSSFMVMELVGGQTLQAVLREKGRLDLEETLRIVKAVASALDFAHANGVIHRDVKPANLMVDASGHVKVMDFGIAKASTSGNITRTGAIMGTPNYMAPEQARGTPVDGRADLFSLGCVLYECLIGQKPFVGESVTAILMKIIGEPPAPANLDALKLPAPLGDVLRRALAKAPEDRYRSGKDLVDAVEAVASGRPAPGPPAATLVSAPTAPVAPLPAPVARRGLAPGKVGWVAAILVVLAGAIWAASTSAGRAAPARVSRFVTKEDPGFVGRILGTKPRYTVTVPDGSTLHLRLETPLSSETAEAGQEITGTTTTSLVIDGFEAFPAGSRVTGHLAHAAGSGKVSGRGELTLEFDRIVTPAGAARAIET
ncbi:MAG TPA: serine/threonine-protein kinase, partial [Vicinamibacteria bacterium]|nr:serine/threonine-protein kinase [Vicinamibacteria bacterium]